MGLATTIREAHCTYAAKWSACIAPLIPLPRDLAQLVAAYGVFDLVGHFIAIVTEPLYVYGIIDGDSYGISLEIMGTTHEHRVQMRGLDGSGVSINWMCRSIHEWNDTHWDNVTNDIFHLIFGPISIEVAKDIAIATMSQEYARRAAQI